MFSKMVIFLFATVGIFALLFATLPSAFISMGYDASLGTDKEIAEYFDLQNVTLYGNAGNDNMTYPYSSLYDHPTAPEYQGSLPSGQYLEVWWSWYPFGTHMLEFRHVEQWWFGFRLLERCNFQYENKTRIPYQRITGTIAESNYNTARNASLFYADSSAIQVTVFFAYNQTTYPNILTAWNSGEISYVLSYDINWNATSVSALTILGQLLTFQAPALGLTGVGGTLISSIIAIPFWICTAVVIIKLVQSVVPFIRGIEE